MSALSSPSITSTSGHTSTVKISSSDEKNQLDNKNGPPNESISSKQPANFIQEQPVTGESVKAPKAETEAGEISLSDSTSETSSSSLSLPEVPLSPSDETEILDTLDIQSSTSSNDSSSIETDSTASLNFAAVKCPVTEANGIRLNAFVPLLILFDHNLYLDVE